MKEQIKKVMYFMDYPNSIGGANKVLMTQAHIMQQRGYNVFVVIPNDKKGRHAPAYDQICEIYGLTSTAAQFSIATCMERIDILDAMERYKEIKKIISNYAPDLIHSTQLNITVELAARELEIPHLMNIYATDESAFLINWMNIYPQYHSADSELLSMRWGNGLGIPSQCIRVAYEKKEYQTAEKGKTEGGGIRIVSIGIFSRLKNQLEIIKFIGECKKHGQIVRLTLVGQADNEYGEVCRKYVEENGLKEDVFFAGFDLDIEHYLAGADLFILASIVESYPGVIVESMANRVPVLSTPVAGVPELLKDGQNGFLANGFVASEIYQAFLRYQKYKSQDKLPQIIQNAYGTYLEHHTYAAAGGQLEEYYQWIMEDYSKKEHSLMGIEQVKSSFCRYIHDTGGEQTKSRIECPFWFLYHVFQVLEKKQNKMTAIWGAGALGRATLDWLSRLGTEKLKIVGFIDTNKSGTYLGYPIIEDIDATLEMCGAIFIAVFNVKDQLKIASYLDRYGIVRNRDYFIVYQASVRI